MTKKKAELLKMIAELNSLRAHAMAVSKDLSLVTPNRQVFTLFGSELSNTVQVTGTALGELLLSVKKHSAIGQLDNDELQSFTEATDLAGIALKKLLDNLDQLNSKAPETAEFLRKKKLSRVSELNESQREELLNHLEGVLRKITNRNKIN